MPLVGRVTGRAEIRRQKDDIRLTALYRVNRSDDYARRFLQGAWSSGERDSDRDNFMDAEAAVEYGLIDTVLDKRMGSSPKG